MWAYYATIMKDYSSEVQDPSVEEEMETYLQDPVLQPTSDVLQYWRENVKYPRLRNLSKKFLCIPPATVHSERLFSTAGQIVDRKRSRLDPQKVQMLVFLNKNL